jgi:hypothetical protein
MNAKVTGVGTLLDQNVSHNTSTFANMDYRLFSQTFVADSSSATLTFSAVTNSGFGIALDAVSVESPAVPEIDAGLLASACTVLGGGVLMLRGRRQKKC